MHVAPSCPSLPHTHTHTHVYDGDGWTRRKSVSSLGVRFPVCEDGPWSPTRESQGLQGEEMTTAITPFAAPAPRTQPPGSISLHLPRLLVWREESTRQGMSHGRIVQKHTGKDGTAPTAPSLLQASPTEHVHTHTHTQVSRFPRGTGLGGKKGVLAPGLGWLNIYTSNGEVPYRKEQGIRSLTGAVFRSVIIARLSPTTPSKTRASWGPAPRGLLVPT